MQRWETNLGDFERKKLALAYLSSLAFLAQVLRIFDNFRVLRVR